MTSHLCTCINLSEFRARAVPLEWRLVEWRLAGPIGERAGLAESVSNKVERPLDRDHILIAIISLIFVLTLSRFEVRVATVALTLTGVSILILLRNAGLVTAASTLTLSFVGLENADEELWRIV